MIVAEQVSKTFEHTAAVQHVSFTVPEGKTLVLLGTSGCGKTTTLKMINRLISPDSGRIFIGDEDIASLRPELLRRKIGYVLQNNGLFPHYTVAENIATVPMLLGWEQGKINTRITELLEKLKLPVSVANRYPAQLSGGQQQRVGIARALAARPPVLLMDEPFGALDPVTRAATKKDLAAVDEFRDKTIIMVTHDVHEAIELGDEICLMDKGRIVQSGTPQELLFRPANDFVRSFFQQEQLSLELHATTPADVWHLLPISAAQNFDTVIDAAQSIWQVMELLSRSGDAVTGIRHGQQIKPAGYAALMLTLTQYRNGTR